MVEQMNNGTPRPDPGAIPQPRHIPKKEEIKKYGLYYFALSPLEQRFYREALADPGMETEIAVLRKVIHSVANGDPKDFHWLPRFTKKLHSFERLDRDIRRRSALKPAAADEALE